MVENDSPAQSGDKSLTTDYKKTELGHMKEINKKCAGNLELQLMVLTTIRKYDRNIAQSASGTLGATLQAAKQNPKAVVKTEDMDDEQAFASMFAKPELQRGRYLYKTWGVMMYKELFRFCFPWFGKEISNKMTDPERFREMIEYQWDIRCTTGTKEPDRIPCTDKKELFTRLRNEMRQRGDMLNKFSARLVLGYVDWAAEGHYAFSVRVDEGVTEVVVTAKILQRSAAMPKDIVESDDGWEKATLRCNHSLHMAYLQTATEMYSLKMLFPHMCKQLKRRNSDSARITAEGLKQGPKKILKGPGETGGVGNGSDCAVGTMLAQPVMPASPGRDGLTAKGELEEDGE